MVKKKIFKKQGSLKKITFDNPAHYIKKMTLDDLTGALVYALRHSDIESFKDILSGYIQVHNKADIARKMHVPRSTLYWMVSSEGNPTLDMISRLISVISKNELARKAA